MIVLLPHTMTILSPSSSSTFCQLILHISRLALRCLGSLRLAYRPPANVEGKDICSHNASQLEQWSPRGCVPHLCWRQSKGQGIQQACQHIQVRSVLSIEGVWSCKLSMILGVRTCPHAHVQSRCETKAKGRMEDVKLIFSCPSPTRSEMPTSPRRSAPVSPRSLPWRTSLRSM